MRGRNWERVRKTLPRLIQRFESWIISHKKNPAALPLFWLFFLKPWGFFFWRTLTVNESSAWVDGWKRPQPATGASRIVSRHVWIWEETHADAALNHNRQAATSLFISHYLQSRRNILELKGNLSEQFQSHSQGIVFCPLWPEAWLQEWVIGLQLLGLLTHGSKASAQTDGRTEMI